jgi:hypothetical protein
MVRARLFVPLLSFASVVAGGLAHAQMPATRMRGDIVSVNGTGLQIKAESGQTVTVKLADKYTISVRARADPAKIAQGAFVGTTAVPGPDGTLVASEVHIFPESMRGTGEGHRPMDAASGSTMTNATVAAVGAGRPAAASRTMTNATVAAVAGGDQERWMTLRYSGGEKVVTIPRDTPIVMIEPGDKSMLLAGAHVVVSGAQQSDGSMLVDRIQVGKDGFVPPL